MSSPLDYLFLGIAAVSVLVGGFRGFVREAFSLAVWIAAFVVASLFSEVLAGALSGTITAPALRFPVAFGTLFVLTLIAGGLLVRLLGMLVDATGLDGLDRVLGTAFGVARAGVLLVVAVAVTEPLFADTPWWQASALVPSLVDARELTFGFFRALVDALSGGLTA